jgi:EAL domain-containing protein (putative c-di-GMP-specific phosphodiesterase class I)
MDDFGTGYSALSSILTTPITGIKLDRSFTAQLGKDEAADRITATVANLVDSLGAHGVAEGIETEDQYARALAHGWVHGQGYLFGRPAPESALTVPAPTTTLPGHRLESSRARMS